MAAIASRPVNELSEEAAERLRTALYDELAVLEAQAVTLQAAVDDLGGHADWNTAFERDVTERSRQRALAEIAEIHDALARMDAGAYGRCERCDRAIPPERLEAIPFARRCVACPPPAAG